MRIIPVLITFFSLLGSCKKASKPDCTPPGEVYFYQDNKNIVISTDTMAGSSPIYRYQVVDGSHLVFTFTYHYEVCPGTIDLDPHRTISFQIPANVTSFDLSDSASLGQANLFVENVCGECFAGIQFLTRGQLAGRKINEAAWIIQGAVASSVSASAFYHINAGFTKN